MLNQPARDSAGHGPPVGALYTVGPLVLGLLLAALLLGAGFGGSETRFDEFALGEGTRSIYARVDEQPVHCKGIADADDCLAGASNRDLPAAALWLGNSQLHAVNQLRPGEESAPAQLFRRLHSQELDLLTFSQPNANVQEHYVLFEYLRARMPLRLLVLAVVFDDMRETGLRHDIALALRDPATVAALETTEIGRQILSNHDDQQTIDPDLAGVRATLQEHSERLMNGWLDRNFPLWELRPQARGELVTGLYRARNTLFGITAQTKRRTIPGRYAANLAALRALLDGATANGIDTLVYVVPLRDDVDIPYAVEDYTSFKRQLGEIVADHGATFANFEGIVPATLWGQKESTTARGGLELDFMHFQAAGHQMLADAVAEQIGRRFPGDPS